MREPVRDKERVSAYPEIEWAAIEGMRHVLVHGYYQISPKQLWDTIDEDIPALKSSIESLLNQL